MKITAWGEGEVPSKEVSRPVIYNKSIEPHSKALSIFQASAEEWKKANKRSEVSFSWFSGTRQDYHKETNKILTNFI